MKKIGIITITSGLNYGNTLQNLGVVLFLRKLGYQVETILNEDGTDHQKHPFMRRLKEVIKILLNYKGQRQQILFERKRQEKYMAFDKQYIPFSKTHITRNEITLDIERQYDYFVAGSDIIWNPIYVSDVMLLKRVPNEKKVAYAASFGVKKLDLEREKEYRQALQTFKSISTREKDGAVIIKKLLGKNVETCVDPTLLVSDKKWGTIARKPEWLHIENEKYVVTYFLGETPDYVRKDIRDRFGENIPVIDFLNKDNIDWYAIDPAEFLYLIQHAKLVYTDSFHGSLFSVIFKRPFFAFARNELGNHAFNQLTSRIENLVTMFSIQQRYIIDSAALASIDWKDVDYAHNDEILSREIARSEQYLKQALE